MGKKGSEQRFTGTAKPYTLWFCLFAFFAVIIFFIVNGKGLYNIGDGIYQQYPNFIYTGIWIRRLLGNIFINHTFALPSWDMSIGMGSDALITFPSVANPLADPFCWISALVPAKAAEYVLTAVIFLKLYLSGLAFSYFCHLRKLPVNSTVAAAMVYVFSSVTYMGLSAAWFFNLFYLFPLLMIGVGRLWEGRGFKFYTLILAWCFLNSYYFTYMMAIFVIIYCILRFVTEKEMHSPGAFFKVFMRFIGCSLLGAGIGFGCQLPAFINMMSLDRLSTHWDVVMFSPGTVKAFLLYAFSVTEAGPEGPWGVAPIALFAVVLLLSYKGRNLLLKILLGVYTLGLFMPVVGSVFNGFNFPTGRFIFGYILLLAYIIAVEFENILTIPNKMMYILLGVSLIYVTVTLLFTDMRGFLSGVSLLIFSISLLFIRGIRNTGRQFTACMLSILISCVIIGFAHLQFYAMSTHIDWGISYDYILRSNGLELLDEDERNELNHTRFDYIPFVIDDVPINSSMLIDINSYDFYNSNYNNDVDRYYLDLAVNSSPQGFMLNGLRGRNYLELMNGTRFLSIQNRAGHLQPPYSYGSAIHADPDHSLYECEDPVSMVYFYDESISTSNLQDISPVEAEELMMNYCITEEGEDEPHISYQHDVVDYEITSTEGIEFTGDDSFVVESTGFMTLSFDDISQSEISVYIEGLDSDRFYAASVSAGYDGNYTVFDTIEGRELTSMYYHWKNAFVVNFGFSEGAVNNVRIFFIQGEYTLRDIKIYSRSSDQLNCTIGAFYDHADMDSVSYEIDGSRVHISASADRDKYLYFAIPYSEGWSASVDGEDVPIQKANIGFMAIPLKAGDHIVELTYRTPYLTEGLCISAVSLLAFTGASVISRKKHEQG